MRPTAIRTRRCYRPQSAGRALPEFLTIDGPGDPETRRMLAGMYIEVQMQRARLHALCDALGKCEPGSPSSRRVAALMVEAVQKLNEMPGGKTVRP